MIKLLTAVVICFAVVANSSSVVNSALGKRVEIRDLMMVLEESNQGVMQSDGVSILSDVGSKDSPWTNQAKNMVVVDAGSTGTRFRIIIKGTNKIVEFRVKRIETTHARAAITAIMSHLDFLNGADTTMFMGATAGARTSDKLQLINGWANSMKNVHDKIMMVMPGSLEGILGYMNSGAHDDECYIEIGGNSVQVVKKMTNGNVQLQGVHYSSSSIVNFGGQSIITQASNNCDLSKAEYNYGNCLVDPVEDRVFARCTQNVQCSTIILNAGFLTGDQNGVTDIERGTCQNPAINADPIHHKEMNCFRKKFYSTWMHGKFGSNIRIRGTNGDWYKTVFDLMSRNIVMTQFFANVQTFGNPNQSDCIGIQI